MKLHVIFLFSFCGVTLPDEEFKLIGLFFGCDRDVTMEYHKALQRFSTGLLKAVAKNNSHFALSQYSVWLSLSAIAEGADGGTQKRLFEILNLPEDSCLREKYYEIATSLESPGNDVSLTRKRLFIVDEGLLLNKTWATAVRASGLVDVKSSPIGNNSNRLEDFIDAKWNITSDSVFIDSLDYKGLWTTAFSNSTAETGDFFNDNGEKIGTVEYMKTSKRVKLAYVPLLNSKLLELPVGNNGRYRMLFLINIGKSSLRRTIEHFPSTLIVDSMPLLIESLIPLEIVIPKFTMSSDLDLKSALQDIGLDSIWKREGEANKFISKPPPTPSSFFQGVTVTIDASGLTQASDPPLLGLSHMATGLAAAVGRSFVANRPFLYILVDSQTRTWLFSGEYSRPMT